MWVEGDRRSLQAGGGRESCIVSFAAPRQPSCSARASGTEEAEQERRRAFRSKSAVLTLPQNSLCSYIRTERCSNETKAKRVAKLRAVVSLLLLYSLRPRTCCLSTMRDVA